MKYRIIVIALILMSILTACSSGDDTDSSSNQNASSAAYTITVTGDSEFTLTRDNATSTFNGVEVADTPTTTLWFGSDDSAYIVSIVFYNTEQPEAGEYEIKDLDLTATDVVLAASITNSTDQKSYTLSTTGTISLSVSDGVYSGTFEYAATDYDGAEVAVSGEFSDLKLR